MQASSEMMGISRHSARQSFSYVTLSAPQTGSTMSGHSQGLPRRMQPQQHSSKKSCSPGPHAKFKLSQTSSSRPYQSILGSSGSGHSSRQCIVLPRTSCLAGTTGQDHRPVRSEGHRGSLHTRNHNPVRGPRNRPVFGRSSPGRPPSGRLQRRRSARNSHCHTSPHRCRRRASSLLDTHTPQLRQSAKSPSSCGMPRRQRWRLDLRVSHRSERRPNRRRGHYRAQSTRPRVRLHPPLTLHPLNCRQPSAEWCSLAHTPERRGEDPGVQI